jgi:ubiquinone/menaquinone biosynthesis C-methylase UbiE
MLTRLREIIELKQTLGMSGAAFETYRIRQAEMRKVSRWPYNLGSTLFGVLYYASLFVVATGLSKTRLDDRTEKLLHDLAQLYDYIPEAISFKAQELAPACLGDAPVHGRGLDLGCGGGYTGTVFRRHSGVTELYGLDLISSFDSRRTYDGYVAANAKTLPFKDCSFDFILCLGVLDHIPELRTVLRECARVLKPGGSLMFAIQAPHFRRSTFWFWVFDRLMGNRRLARDFQDFRDIFDLIFHYHSGAEWHATLQECGFSAAHIQYIFPARNLFFYDLLNIQVYFPRYVFAERALRFLARHPKLRGAVRWAGVTVSRSLLRSSVSEFNATRYFIRASTPASCPRAI